MVSLTIQGKVIAYSVLYFLITENEPATITRLKEDTLTKRLGIHMPTNIAIGSYFRRSRLFTKSELSQSHSNPAYDAAAVYCLGPEVYHNLLRHKTEITRRAGMPLKLVKLIDKYAGIL